MFINELQRLLGKKPLEHEILKEAMEAAREKSGLCARYHRRCAARWLRCAGREQVALIQNIPSSSSNLSAPIALRRRCRRTPQAKISRSSRFN
jgi:hypothetical protein